MGAPTIDNTAAKREKGNDFSTIIPACNDGNLLFDWNYMAAVQWVVKG
jgi:hypothetical protein